MSAAMVEPREHAPLLTGASRRPTVVLCDDEAAIRKLYRRALRSTEVHVVDAVDGDECLELVAAHRPVLVVLDLTLPGRSGFEVLAELATSAPTTRVVVVSGMVTPTIVEEALALGATACVEKVRFIPQLRAMVGALVP